MAKILVVDDEPMVRTVLVEILQTAGPQVVTADSAGQGFEFTKKHSPDLVITDIEIPAGHPAGLELLKQIKEYNHSIAVVMITGAASKQRIVAALRGGAQDFIEKPLSIDKIIQCVTDALLHQKKTSAY